MSFDIKNFDYKRLVKFEHNMGAKDKKIRLYAGVSILAISLFTASVVLLLVGGILTATSFFGWSPTYSAFGHDSLTESDKAALAQAAETPAETDKH